MINFKVFEPSPLPTKEQFVVIWEHNNTIWSSTYKHIDGVLHKYCSDTDKWRVSYDRFNFSNYSIFVK